MDKLLDGGQRRARGQSRGGRRRIPQTIYGASRKSTLQRGRGRGRVRWRRDLRCCLPSPALATVVASASALKKAKAEAEATADNASSRRADGGSVMSVPAGATMAMPPAEPSGPCMQQRRRTIAALARGERASSQSAARGDRLPPARSTRAIHYSFARCAAYCTRTVPTRCLTRQSNQRKPPQCGPRGGPSTAPARETHFGERARTARNLGWRRRGGASSSAAAASSRTPTKAPGYRREITAARPGSAPHVSGGPSRAASCRGHSQRDCQVSCCFNALGSGRLAKLGRCCVEGCSRRDQQRHLTVNTATILSALAARAVGDFAAAVACQMAKARPASPRAAREAEVLGTRAVSPEQRFAVST
jgi:hypothetical protein